MDNLPDKLTEEEFLKLSELHKKYEACDQVRYKILNAAVEIVIPLIENMKEIKKELNDFKII